MCGIFFLHHKNISEEEIKKSFNTLESRGPDYSSFNIIDGMVFGFKRLIINDVSSNGNQPFLIDDIVLICNGEIYNYKKLVKKYKFDYKSKSDCEVIIHLYKKFGIEKTINLLDGVFAFVLYDKTNEQIYFARDRIGVRPLFYGSNGIIAASSEAKALDSLNIKEIKQFPSGTFMVLNEYETEYCTYFCPIEKFPQIKLFNKNRICDDIKSILTKSVKKRLLSDKPIGCLLSGGLDSSVIAYILSKVYHKKIKTFSIGFEDSPDVMYARKVANFINSDHHEVIINYQEALESLEDIIYSIESYDITTVRASVGMYLLSKYISENHSEKVIFSGEGADEILCGYLYFHNAPNDTLLNQESKRLIKELPYFDVLRADRCTASHGLELRVPFLDKDFVNYCLELDGQYKKPIENIEKYYLRKAFENCLPKEIVWRVKETFSDGISGEENIWYKKLKEFTNNQISDEEFDVSFPSKEAFYYYKIFKKKFKNFEKPIPNYWMPKWDETDDPSARTLQILNKIKNKLI